MNDDDCMNVFLKCLTAVICTIVVVSGGCVANTHLAISRDLQAGKDPLAVACAHNNDGAADACLVLATKAAR